MSDTLGKILSAILLIAALSATPAFAQTARLTTSEEVAISFFKMGNAKPDFAKWALKSDKHAMVQKARQKEYLEQETRRLNAIWNSYDPEKRMIEVKGVVFVTLNTALSETGDETYSMTMAFEEGTVDYFPFQFQDYTIAVIPQKLNTLMTQPLPEAQFRLLLSTFEGKQTGQAMLNFQLKPVKADLSRPYDMDGHEQWMFVTDVAGLSLKNKQGMPLWNYSAPWYVTPTTQGVREMFSKQEHKERSDDAAEGIAP